MMRRALFVGLTAAVLAVVVISFVSSLAGVNRIFPGFLVYPNLLVSPFYLPRWIPPQEGIAYPWTLEAVDSTALHSAAELDAALSSLASGEIHLFTFRKDRDRVTKGFPVTTFGSADFFTLCGSMFIAGLFIIAVGICAGFIVHRTAAPQVLFLACLAQGGWMGALPDWMVSHRIPLVLPFFVSMATAFTVGYPLFLPFPWPKLTGRHQVIALPGLVALGVVLFALFLPALTDTNFYLRMDSLTVVLLAVCWALYAGRLVRILTSTPQGRDHSMARTSFAGFFVSAFLGVPFVFLVYFSHISFPFMPIFPLLSVIAPASVAVALWKGSRV